MLALASTVVSIMFAFLFGFASIKAEEIPAGIMPQKRQVAGTGGAAQSSTTQQQPDPSTTTSNPPAQSTNNPPASSNNNNNGGTTSDNNNNGGTTSDNSPAPSSQNNGGNNNNNPSSVVPTSVEVTTTNADGSTVTSKIATTTLAGAGDSSNTKTNNNNNPIQTKSGTKNSVVKVGSKTIDPATLEKKTTVKKPLVAQETRHQTKTSFWTSDGHVYSSVYTTENVFASTTGYQTATIAPSLANGGGDGSNLSSHTKAIIGGVVGGIGGAILIGGLAFVAWRLWGKKKQDQDQDDYSYGSPHDSINAQKRYSQNTLSTEGYHNPGRVNTASNF